MVFGLKKKKINLNDIFMDKKIIEVNSHGFGLVNI
jgi:hypothetical protein